MKSCAFAIAGLGALFAVGLGLAGTAAAGPGARADDAVNSLQAEGYSVQLNGGGTANLSACTVNSVSGLSAGGSAASRTAIVDVICPDGC